MVRQGSFREIAGRFSALIRFQPLDAAARLAIAVKQIISLGQEFGLRIIQVDPATVRALSPEREALSVRSMTSVSGGRADAGFRPGSPEQPRCLPPHRPSRFPAADPGLSGHLFHGAGVCIQPVNTALVRGQEKAALHHVCIGILRCPVHPPPECRECHRSAPCRPVHKSGNPPWSSLQPKQGGRQPRT